MASTSTGTVNSSSNGTSSISADKKTGPCQICRTLCTLQCSACFNVYYCSTEHQRQDRRNHKRGVGCSPLQLGQDDQHGRYWIATRDVKAGELILKERPAIVSPLPLGNNMNICVSCCAVLLSEDQIQGEMTDQPGKAKLMGAIRKSCQKCGWPVCGVDCEKAPVHAENECQLFASRSIKFLVSAPSSHAIEAIYSGSEMYAGGLSLIRGVMLKLKDSTTWDKIMELQVKNKRAEFAGSGLEKEIIQHRCVAFAEAISQQFKAADLAPKEDWVRLQGITEINQFGISRYEVGKVLETQMTGLYVQGSLFNHSCMPNAYRNISYSPAFELHIRAATDIKKGDMITINYYTETMMYGTEKRLEKTTLSSGFVCQCARCLDPTELGTYSSAIICDRCPEKGIMLPNTFQNSLEPYRCQTAGCSNTKTRLSVNCLISALHREISADESVDRLISDPVLLEAFISRLSGKILHPNHWLLLEAERSLLGAYKHTYSTNPKHLTRYLQYGRRRVQFTGTTSPGISVELAMTQLDVLQAMMLDVFVLEKELRLMITRGEACDRWTEIYKWASDSLKYWQTDVEHTPPLGKEISKEVKMLKEIMMVARANLQLDRGPLCHT